MILKWAILHNEYFYFWYFKCILMLILLYFYLSKILNAGLVTEYFLHCNIASFIKQKILTPLPTSEGWYVNR